MLVAALVPFTSEWPPEIDHAGLFGRVAQRHRVPMASDTMAVLADHTGKRLAEEGVTTVEAYLRESIETQWSWRP